MTIEDDFMIGALIILSSPDCPQCGRKMAVLVTKEKEISYYCSWCGLTEVEEEDVEI